MNDEGRANRACLYSNQSRGTFCEIASCSNQGDLEDYHEAEGDARSWPFLNPCTMPPVVQAPLPLEASGGQFSSQQFPGLLSFTLPKAQLSPKSEEEQDILATLAVDPLLTKMLDNTIHVSSTCDESTFSTVSLRGNETVLSQKQAPGFYHNNNLGNVNTDTFTSIHVPCCNQILDRGFTDNNVNNIVNVEERASSADEKIKDHSYWKRRKRNNIAAKRSRAARREREILNQNKIEQLKQENQALRLEVLYLRKENARLKGYLS